MTFGSIADEDWTILPKKEEFLVNRETQDAEGMRYSEQVEIDKEVFVFHTWPLNAPDDSTPTISPGDAANGGPLCAPLLR
jgi:hypothetical protein